jgi:hypothetical protein
MWKAIMAIARAICIEVWELNNTLNGGEGIDLKFMQLFREVCVGR